MKFFEMIGILYLINTSFARDEYASYVSAQFWLLINDIDEESIAKKLVKLETILGDEGNMANYRIVVGKISDLK